MNRLMRSILVICLVLLPATTAYYATYLPPTKKSCKLPLVEDTCRCITRVRREVEAECCCVGMKIQEIPQNLTHHLRALMLIGVGIEQIQEEDFLNYPHLEEVEIAVAPQLRSFNANSLRNHTSLKKLSIKYCPALKTIQGPLMEPHHNMQKLDIHSNGLEILPHIHMSDKHKFDAEIDASENRITTITSGSLANIRARSLRLSGNKLVSIQAEAFVNSSIHNLELNNNRHLSDLSPNAFQLMKVLNNLDLSRTALTSLPQIGMETVKILILTEVESLKQLPPVLAFSSLKKAAFTYPHHCCLFKHASKLDFTGDNTRELRERLCRKKLEDQKKERVKTRTKRQMKSEAPTYGNWTDLMSAMFSEIEPGNFSLEYGEDEQPPNIFHDEGAYSDEELGAARCLEEEELQKVHELHGELQCTPEPDAMNPCENIVGYLPLRYVIWFIWTLSIVFNAVVWILLAMAYEHRLRAHYFFMFNLSFANALTATYLGFLAVKDQMTADEYFRFAVDWQTGLGCSAAGFLCVFSSLLSILSMFFIAFEIAYSTRQAIYGRHLPFSVCVYCVIFSYIFSIVMAALPLFGISSYSKTSTCLPLHVDSQIERVVVVFGLLMIIFAFVGMVACYGSIVKILIDPNTPSRPEDQHIIFKMFLIVIADLVCWMPSVALGLAAAMGYPLISISVAKVFIVCFFPVNTFTNPFLYVFLTKVIQRKVKKKALPVIRKMVSTPVHTINSLSNLYHPHAPHDKRRRKSDESNKFMSLLQGILQHSPNQNTQTTQSSWIASSTPRGSAESQMLLDEEQLLDRSDGRRRSTPRVSFQSDCSCLNGQIEVVPHRSLSRFSGILKKVSAIPEVSDLSEHSSESHHEHVITHPSAAARPNCQGRRRFETWHTNSSDDSGRSSLASIFARRTRAATDEGGDTVDTESTFSGVSEEGRGTMIPMIPLNPLRPVVEQHHPNCWRNPVYHPLSMQPPPSYQP